MDNNSNNASKKKKTTVIQANMIERLLCDIL